MRFLTFLLAGPLQCWGEASRWDARETADMPTKSAIIGLLGCCMGIGRGDIRLRELSRKLHLAVRADKVGRLMTDFHTVQGPGGVILNAEHKKRGSTIITPKQYLQDAAFQVFLYGDDDALDKSYAAMQAPKWVACLGRRSCPPAYPIVPTLVEYPSVDEALSRYYDDKFKSERNKNMLCQIELAADEDADHVIIRQDEVERADLDRYSSRRVRIGRAEYVSKQD